MCSYTAAIPAIIKLLKTKRSNDYSIIESCLTLIGTTCWTVYIFSTKQDMILYIGTIADQIMYSWWNILVILYYKRGNNKIIGGIKQKWTK
jgi:uncharacterized protein with PQ loop repeat